MTLRDELIPIVDSLRGEVVDTVAGLRLDDVVVRRRAWSGGQLGRGTVTETDLALTPRPKVKPPDPRRTPAVAGAYEEGDLNVERISLAYTAAQLGESPSAASEVVWMISGEAYRLVSLTEGYLQWSAYLRRMRQRA